MEICTGKTAIVSSVNPVAERVLVSGIAIDISPTADVDAALTLGDGTADQTSTLVGDINLKAPQSGSHIATLTFDRTYVNPSVFDHTFTGSGSIIGSDDLAQIEIPDDSSSNNTLVLLTIDDAAGGGSKVSIKGRMVVGGLGEFVNDGAVIANAAGTLDFQLTGARFGDTEADDLWQVTVSGAKLLFTVEPDALAGAFTVSAGELRAGIDPGGAGDDIDVVTTGDLSHTGGKIIAGVNDSFTFNN